VITVVDTTPPVITPGSDDLFCLWPPNHRYVCFSKNDFSPEITDNCSYPIEWRFVGCPSTEPDDAPGKGTGKDKPKGGEGSTRNDCVVCDDGQTFCVRSERSGTGKDEDGRRYDVVITATDACGNTSGPVTIGTIHVPHDESDAQGCIDADKEGCKDPEPPPCGKGK
jgi:hypothetical protein